ncbi:hypothetical protein J3R83DRAFT_4990 [Lanmaoa asiatica]|nr:hypothetical protein J3R83DRAFT_4990 [Lanmaoa asiatica]
MTIRGTSQPADNEGSYLHTFLHSWAHRFGLQRLESTIAIRVILSAIDGVLAGVDMIVLRGSLPSNLKSTLARD